MLILEAQYFPSIAYFVALANAKEVTIDTYEHFEKQTYRNRCTIVGANGSLDLTIPIQHTKLKIPMNDVQIDYRQKWLNTHWRAIQSAYGKAPFFDFYSVYIEDELKREYNGLLELNKALLTLCLKLLQLDVKVLWSEKYVEPDANGITDFRSFVHPKKQLAELSGFQPKAYTQIFGSEFVPNMSILDLLFCEGPNALEIIKQSGELHKN